MLADRSRADEAHAAHQRVGHHDLGLDTRAGHGVDDALGQAGLVQQLEQAHAGRRHHAGSFSTRVLPVTMHSGNIQPKGIMAGEVEGRDAGEDADRLAVAHGIVPGGHVHERLALHGHRSADPDIDPSMILMTSPRASSRFLPSSGRTARRPLRHALEQGPPPKSTSCASGSVWSTRSGTRLWALSMALSTSAGVHTAPGEHLAGARVGDVHLRVGRRLPPLAVDAVLQRLALLSSDCRHCFPLIAIMGLPE